MIHRLFRAPSVGGFLIPSPRGGDSHAPSSQGGDSCSRGGDPHVPSPRGGGLGWGFARRWALALLAVLVLAAPAQAQQIDLSLNVAYNTPTNPNSGGSWELVGKSSGSGIVGVRTFLTDVSGGVTNVAPQGTVNGGDDAGFFVFGAVAGPSYTEIVIGQAELFPTGGDEEAMFYGVGTLTEGAPNYPGKPGGSNSIGPEFSTLTGVVNEPWATGDFFGDPDWDTAARLVGGTFAAGMTPAFAEGQDHEGQVFTSLGSSTAAGNLSDFQTTTLTTIVRSNLMSSNGDYNGNGVVDAADYTVWRDTLGSTVAPFTGADGNGNGTIDAPDYDFWKSQFGTVIGSGSNLPSSGLGGGAVAVPEPATATLALLAGLLAMARAASFPRFAAKRSVKPLMDANGTLMIEACGGGF